MRGGRRLKEDVLVKKKNIRPKPPREMAPLQQYPGTKLDKLNKLVSDWRGCVKCPLGEYRVAETESRVSNAKCFPGTDSSAPEIVFGDGDPDAPIMVIGEAPGAEEESCGVPFVGASGKLLNQILGQVTSVPEFKRAYYDYYYARPSKQSDELFNNRAVVLRRSEFFIVNAVACRPPENRPPTQNEIKACWDLLRNIIYIVDPIVIVACGNQAMAALTHRSGAKITKERGNADDTLIDGMLGPIQYPVVPTFHPSYLLRKADWGQDTGDFAKSVQDFRAATAMADRVRLLHYRIPIPDRTPLQRK